MTLSIIIVNWNVKALLQRCLESILNYVKDVDYEVIVVDNCSQDGSQEYLKELSKKRNHIRAILNEKNFGFGKANNQAFKKTKGEFVLFLNPDTEFIKENGMKKIIELMKQNKKWGIVGCQLIGPDKEIQPSVRNFPTIFSQLIIILKLQYLFPKSKVLKKYFQTDFNYQKTKEVDQVAGSFILTRRKILDQVGSFDERFHLWFEDADLCYRVKKAGWQIIYCPKVKILHHGGKSFWQLMSIDRQRIYNKSLLTYFQKHSYISRYWPLILVQPISLFLALLSGVYPAELKKKIKKKLNVD